MVSICTELMGWKRAPVSGWRVAVAVAVSILLMTMLRVWIEVLVTVLVKVEREEEGYGSLSGSPILIAVAILLMVSCLWGGCWLKFVVCFGEENGRCSLVWFWEGGRVELGDWRGLLFWLVVVKQTQDFFCQRTC